MITIVDQVAVKNYIVLFLSESLPNRAYNTLLIDGVEYKPEIVYDLDASIAIIAEGDFIGKEIKFK